MTNTKKEAVSDGGWYVWLVDGENVEESDERAADAESFDEHEVTILGG